MRIVAGLVLAGLIAAACTPGPSGTPIATGAGQPAASSAGLSPGPTLPSQTETSWGRIWDGLPPWFPMPPGSQIATDTGQGPSSGQLQVPASRDEVVRFYRQALGAADATVGTDGPLEDGSVKVTASGEGSCRIELSIRETGARQSMVTVLYGASCPFE
jgi:hypothetical protein